MTVSPRRLYDWGRKQHKRTVSLDETCVVPFTNVGNRSTIKQQDRQKIKQYSRSELHIGCLLGEGGFACVFDVKVKSPGSPKNKSKMALKQLRQDLLKDKDTFTTAARSLVREAVIMQKLSGHVNILELRGISSDACAPLCTSEGFDAFFLVTDALKETMETRLVRWNKNPAQQLSQQQERWRHKLNYALQIAKALAHCHENRIIYRDCKCANIGFSDKRTIQLFDFGLARTIPDEDYKGDGDTLSSSLDSRHGNEEVFRMSMCGTQRWVAPEVYSQGWYNLKSDVYSWSMTAVELFTQKKPHPHMSLPVHKILVLEGGRRPAVEKYPAELQRILKRAWAQNIADRCDMSEVCVALKSYIGNERTNQLLAMPVLSAVDDKSDVLDLLQRKEQTRNDSVIPARQRTLVQTARTLYMPSAA